MPYITPTPDYCFQNYSILLKKIENIIYMHIYDRYSYGYFIDEETKVMPPASNFKLVRSQLGRHIWVYNILSECLAIKLHSISESVCGDSTKKISLVRCCSSQLDFLSVSSIHSFIHLSIQKILFEDFLCLILSWEMIEYRPDQDPPATVFFDSKSKNSFHHWIGRSLRARIVSYLYFCAVPGIKQALGKFHFDI